MAKRKNKATRKASKPRRSYRIGSVAKPKRRIGATSKSMKSKITGRVMDAAMTGAGVVAGSFINGKLIGMVPNPYARAGVMVALGVLAGSAMPALGAIGTGIAASGVANVGAQLLLASGSMAGIRGVGALTAAEKRMIEAAAAGEEIGAATPQSEVLTGLYDTAGVLD